MPEKNNLPSQNKGNGHLTKIIIMMMEQQPKKKRTDQYNSINYIMKSQPLRAQISIIF